MTEKEIYVLNRALDGKDIYMLPPLDQSEMSELIIHTVKEQLILKRILSDYAAFTDAGIRFCKKLKLYKEANRYLTVGNITVGIRDDNKNVMLMYNPFLNEYKLKYIQKTDWVKDIAGAYSFIGGNNSVYEEEDIEMSQNMFEERYRLKHDNSVVIKTFAKETYRKYMVFSVQNELYLYDYNERRLYKRVLQGLSELLRERVDV